jgi:hypothetical protein
MSAAQSVCQIPGFQLSGWQQFSGTGQSISIVAAFWCEIKKYILLPSEI